MSNETCTVAITDIYGAEWWERNKAELDREWEWEFRLVQPKEKYAIKYSRGITINGHNEDGFPRIILHRRKPKPPTLREVYSSTVVTIINGFEWVNEWRRAGPEELYLTPEGSIGVGPIDQYRLILRERPKRVWFKAEEKARIADFRDWIWDVSMEKWVRLEYGGGFHLCATRHEEIDQTVQVVTQADVDEVVGR